MIQHASDLPPDTRVGPDTRQRKRKRSPNPPRSSPPSHSRPTASVSTDNLLLYNAAFQILICRECQYAIQPTALDNHLLRHKIYRAARQRLVESVAHLPICEPDEVALPEGGAKAIDGLSIVPGWRCSVAGCAHLCASVKRLRHHWTHKHPGSEVDQAGGLGTQVRLQTFFRGAKLRYFEVSLAAATDTRTPRDAAQAEGAGLNTSSPGSLALDSDGARYFHHFLIHVAPSLLCVEDLPFWQTTLIETIFADPSQMAALQVVSAGHSALTALSDTQASTHAAYSHFQSRQYLSTGVRVSAPPDAVITRLVALHQLVLWVIESRYVPTPPLVPFDILHAIRLLRDVTHRVDPVPPKRQQPGLATPRRNSHSALDHLPLKLAELYGRPSNFHEPWEVMRAIDSLSACLADNESAAAWAWCADMTAAFEALLAAEVGAALVVVGHWAGLALKRKDHSLAWLCGRLADVVVGSVLQLLEGHTGACDIVRAMLASLAPDKT